MDTLAKDMIGSFMKTMIKKQNEALLKAVEYGHNLCQKGESLEATLEKFKEDILSKTNIEF